MPTKYTNILFLFPLTEPAKKLPRKSTVSDDKKSTKKKKDNEPVPVTSTTVIDDDFPVEVGDKLKVYYHEKKVTYEAKVIEISGVQPGTPLYLVHYTGWNNRYDEWVQRERIAENLSNNNKNKKCKMQEKKESRSSTDTPTKDRSAKSTPIPAPKRSNRGRSDSNPPRSLTPSSVTPLTTRTKSPAIIPNHKRSQRTHTNSTSRRTSNPLSDMSQQSDDSSSDSDEPISKKKPPKSEKKPRNKASADNSDSDVEDEDEDNETENTNSNPTSTVSSKSGYDLNQIRSELKGFEEMKPSTPDSGSQEGSSEKTNTVYDFRVGDTEDPTASKSPLSLTKDEMTKSSTDLSSETESFGDADDDSQSSDKTTALENMTEKLQQKMAVKKDEKDSSSIEKIIKESLEEKRQEKSKIRSSLLVKLEQVEVKPEEKKTSKFILPDSKTSLQEQISIVMGTASPKPSNLLSTLKTPEKSSPSTSTTSILKGLDDNDIYEFKEEIKEPFEFEMTRKSSPFGGDGEKVSNFDEY